MSRLPMGKRLVILVVLGALPACGSGDDGSGATDTGPGVSPSEEAAAPDFPDVAELVGRLPADDQASVIDLAAVREDLGLAADDDLTDLDDDAVRRALSAAALAIPYLASPDVNLLLKEALDTGQIQAGASGSQTIVLSGSAPDRGVAVVATEQDPNEVLDRLREEGWQEVADDIVTDEEASAARTVYTAVGARDGLVVLGRDPSLVAEVLDREPDDPQGAAALLDTVDGPLRTAQVTDVDACGGATVAGEQFDDPQGEIVVAAGEAGADDVILAEGDQFWPRRGVVDSAPYEVVAVEVGDDAVRLTWVYTGDPAASSSLSSIPLSPEAADPDSWLVDCAT